MPVPCYDTASARLLPSVSAAMCQAPASHFSPLTPREAGAALISPPAAPRHKEDGCACYGDQGG